MVSNSALLVWSKPLNLVYDGRLYHVRLFDTVKHSLVMQANNKTAEQVDALVKWHKEAGYNVKAFAYEMNSEVVKQYGSKSRPVTFQRYERRTRSTFSESSSATDGSTDNASFRVQSETLFE